MAQNGPESNSKTTVFFHPEEGLPGACRGLAGGVPGGCGGGVVGWDMHAPAQLTLCLWETSVERAPDGAVTLRPRVPLSHMSTRQAAQVLGCSPWTVQNLYQAGLLDGYKPGAKAKRRDGRASNATLRLDSGSVLEYRERQRELARQERAG
jgi:hypothetical protein